MIPKGSKSGGFYVHGPDCLHSNLLVHVHTCTHMHAHMHAHTYIHTYIDTHTYMNTHIHAHTYMHTHIHTHTYIHTHAYMNKHKLLELDINAVSDPLTHNLYCDKPRGCSVASCQV